MNIRYTPQEIVDAISTNEWKIKKDFPIDKFVNHIAPDKYAVEL